MYIHCNYSLDTFSAYIRNELCYIATLFNLMQSIKLSVEDITALVPNAKTITSSTHSEQNISSSGSLVTYDHKTSSPVSLLN
jgi:hypothetical protein